MPSAVQQVSHPPASGALTPASPSGIEPEGGRRGRHWYGGDRRASTPTKAYGTLERAFAACSLIGVAGTTGGALLAVNGYGPFPLLGACSAVMLVTACLGRFAQESVIRFQRGELARVYASAMQAPQRAVFERRTGPTRMEALNQSVIDMLESVRLKVTGGDHVRLWAMAMRRALDSRAETSRALAAALGEDAHAIAAAAATARRAEADISAEAGELFDHAGRAVEATAFMAEEADALATSVRVVTAQIRKTAVFASDLAHGAISAQRDAASVTDMTAGLIDAAEQLRAILQRAQAAGGAGSDAATMAEEMTSLAAAGQAALDAMMQTARRLKADAETMAITVSVMNDTVQAQGTLGQALSESAVQQSEAITRLVRKAGSARGEIVALQERAGGMERRDLGLGAGSAARRAVERLPDHAEAVAKILRDLPVFESKVAAETV